MDAVQRIRLTPAETCRETDSLPVGVKSVNSQHKTDARIATALSSTKVPQPSGTSFHAKLATHWRYRRLLARSASAWGSIVPLTGAAPGFTAPLGLT